jgi:Methyltransferase domain
MAKYRSLTIATSLCIFIAILYLSRNTHHVVEMPDVVIRTETVAKAEIDVSEKLSFLPPRHRRLDDCRRLFVESAVANFNMSADYWALVKEFENATVLALKGGSAAEGFSHQVPSQYLTMHFLASQPTVKHVCETGFNVGHSSFNFLTANRQLIVHSFDLGNHDYAHVMAEFMSKRFPGRFFVHFGDSTKTVPEFIRSNPEYRCDLLYVDGGHTYDVALADMMNFASVANVENGAIMVFDDYPSTLFNLVFGTAWEDVRRWGYIEEKMRCFFAPKNDRGFTIGRVLRRPSVEWSHSPV